MWVTPSHNVNGLIEIKQRLRIHLRCAVKSFAPDSVTALEGNSCERRMAL